MALKLLFVELLIVLQLPFLQEVSFNNSSKLLYADFSIVDCGFSNDFTSLHNFLILKLTLLVELLLLHFE